VRAYPLEEWTCEPPEAVSEPASLMSFSSANAASCLVCGALPPEAEEPMAIPDAAVRDDLDVLDRITGSLIGAAIGDGLGDLARHGHMVDSWPIPDPAELRVGGATQTMLFTLEGMIRMLVRLNIKGIGPGYQVLRHALDRWLFTQHPEDPEDRPASVGVGQSDMAGRMARATPCSSPPAHAHGGRL